MLAGGDHDAALMQAAIAERELGRDLHGHEPKNNVLKYLIISSIIIKFL
jgi:hypothetical protein